MSVGELVFFIIISIGLVLNLTVFITQRAKRKRKQPISFELPTRYFVLYNVGFVFFVLLDILRAYLYSRH